MIVISDLTFSYSKDKYLFKDMDMKIERGTICGLLGLNGAGKSTLLKIINGLLVPDTGSVTVDRIDVFPRNVDILSRIYLLQENLNLPNVKISFFEKLYSPFYPKFDKAMFYEILQKFSIVVSENIKNLSMGQKKKVHLAFALATQCDILFLDEPTNGLDIPSKSIFRTFISQYTHADQVIIISTHQVRDLGQLLDRLIVLDAGNVVVNETIHELSRQYATASVSSEDQSHKIIYREAGVLEDRVLIRKDENDDHSELDIELFFAAHISKISPQPKFVS